MSEEERMKKEESVKLPPAMYSNNYQVTFSLWPVKNVVEITKYHAKSETSLSRSKEVVPKVHFANPVKNNR